MPFFETPKPRQFHYNPRYYDPEKERWEAMKQKYHDEHSETTQESRNDSSDEDLAYFQSRVQQLDQSERRKQSRLTWRDLFRKRKMPTFHYTPRFNDDGTLKAEYANQIANQSETPSATNVAAPSPIAENKYTTPSPHKIKIRRRFDFDDPDYLKPVSSGKIFLYVLIVCLLLYWILS